MVKKGVVTVVTPVTPLSGVYKLLFFQEELADCSSNQCNQKYICPIHVPFLINKLENAKIDHLP
jgi:hypothetical protein